MDSLFACHYEPKLFTYTIFIDWGTQMEHIDLPEGTSLIQATDLAVRKSKEPMHRNSAIRLGAYKISDPKWAKCVWANEVAYQRNLVNNE